MKNTAGMLRAVTKVACLWGILLLVSPLFLGPPPLLPRTLAELQVLRVVIVRPSSPYLQNQPCPNGFVRSWEDEHYRCYEMAEACPEGFQERRETGWRLCTDPDSPSYPPTFVRGPKIAGVPYYEAQAILARHRQELRRPEVLSYGLSDTGVHVVVSDLSTQIPTQLETLPITLEVCTGCVGHVL